MPMKGEEERSHMEQGAHTWPVYSSLSTTPLFTYMSSWRSPLFPLPRSSGPAVFIIRVFFCEHYHHRRLTEVISLT